MSFVEAGAAPVAALRMAPGAGAFTLRPAVAADAAALRAFCEALAPPDLRLLGAGALTAAAFAQGARGPGGFGLVAMRGQGAAARPAGLARLCADPDRVAAEFALIVHPDARGRGLGRLLLEGLLLDARRRGLVLVRAATLPGNAPMLALARACAFQLLPAADGAIELVRVLAPFGQEGP